ncbi:MAG: hypothetical protein JNK15_01365 [Planctomycetes bacterium]|nr:hypothetical protein [Planctomycetota bacterium]
MKKLLTLALTLALSFPVFAQRGPKLEQTITNGDVKMSLNYTSISYGEGKTVAALLSKDGAEMRSMMNERAGNRPPATFTTSVDVKVNDVTLPAGEHKVYFTIGDDLAVNMNFKSGDKVQTVKLDLKTEEGHESKQLLMCLYAGDNGGAGAYLAFGKMSGMVNFVPAGKGEPAKTGK